MRELPRLVVRIVKWKAGMVQVTNLHQRFVVLPREAVALKKLQRQRGALLELFRVGYVRLRG